MIDHIFTHSRARILSMVLVAACGLQPGLSHGQDISTVAGNGTGTYSGDGGAATDAGINIPYDVAVDAAGNTYIADTSNRRIRKVTPAGAISTIAGNGTYGFSGDGGPATDASLSFVYKLAVDATGNVYLADHANQRIRKVTPNGLISTIAGTGIAGYSGDGGLATNAQLHGPIGLAVDSTGNIFFSEASNHVVRKITPAGLISTVAGNGSPGFSGDGGLATAAKLNVPLSVTVDAGGRLYIAGNERIRRVDAGGVITTIAGNGSYNFSGDGGSAVAASFRSPYDAKSDASGNVYIADAGNNRIRKIDTSGMISTIAGTGVYGYGGDGGPAAYAQFKGPLGIDVMAGKLHIADTQNHRIRMVALEFSSCAAEGFTGSKLTLCRQICEIDQTPTKLTSLIKLYISAYRMEPPCAQ